MSETHATTLAIQELVGQVSSLKTVELLDQSDSFPHTVTQSNVTSIACVNTNTSNILTITVTLSDASSFAIPIPASNTYQTEFEAPIATIAIAGTSPTFSMELLRRGNS